MKTNVWYYAVSVLLTCVFGGPPLYGQSFEMLSNQSFNSIIEVTKSGDKIVVMADQPESADWKFIVTDGTVSGTSQLATFPKDDRLTEKDITLVADEQYIYFQKIFYDDVYYIHLQSPAPFQRVQVDGDREGVHYLRKADEEVFGISEYGYFNINETIATYQFMPSFKFGFSRPFAHKSGVYVFWDNYEEFYGTSIVRITSEGSEILSYLGRLQYVYDISESFGSIGEKIYPFVNQEDSVGFHTELFVINDTSVDSLYAFPSQLIIQDVIYSDKYMYLLLAEQFYDCDLNCSHYDLWRTDGTTAGTEYLEDLGVSNNYSYSLIEDIICDYESDYLGCQSNLKSNIFDNEDGRYYFLEEDGVLNLYSPQGLYSSYLNPSLGHLTILEVLGDDLIVYGGNKLYKYNMKPNCGAVAVVSFTQGQRNNNSKVVAERSNPEYALANPQENDEINFVALGFGGSITLDLGSAVYDEGTAEPDLILLETSFGRADQFCYSEGESNNPEQAFVELSEDGVSWYSLPNVYCRTSFIDIKPAVDQGMAYASFIRITDASNPSAFPKGADGFDVDGVITCREEVEAAKGVLTNARTITSSLFNSQFINKAPDEVEEGFTLYPNPVTNGELTLQFKVSQTQEAHIRVIDITGKEKLKKTVSLSAGANAVKLEVSTLSKGTYIVELSAGDRVENTKIIIQ
ncbi:T9SS type A sorting domain-containing protein [Fulvivirga maritima]|uniref:T9SS type A sorting domain-containing protein n=1 Tax=Fulvivirga maritima TaxID=2904247 RepID=UPI001F34FA64|nr:T9SS type A sorting domain-containing protein [Fulvivirga maritima]UII24548.1 T9SS type A sorting domain-containing protein [Fulvivirga maritima]